MAARKQFFKVAVATFLAIGAIKLGAGFFSSSGRSYERPYEKAVTDDELAAAAPIFNLNPTVGCDLIQDQKRFIEKVNSGNFPKSRLVLEDAFRRMSAQDFGGNKANARCVIEFIKLVEAKGDDFLSRVRREMDSYPEEQREALEMAPRIDQILADSKALMKEMETEAGQYKTINGFVVSQISPGLYEVGNPWGRNRLILRTTRTTFTSKGMFSMRVKFIGNRQVKLNEHAGGFDAEWPAYEEVDQDEVDRVVQAFNDAKRAYRETVRRAPQIKKDAEAAAAKFLANIERVGRSVASEPR